VVILNKKGTREMIYKTFEEWKAGQWLEDGEPRTKAYTEDELLLIEMGWQYGFDAGKETNQLTDEEIEKVFVLNCNLINETFAYRDFARAILRKAQEK
jgi:hypothetical protein